MLYKIRVLTEYLPELPREIVDIEDYYEAQSRVCPMLVTERCLRDGLKVGKVYHDPEYGHLYKVLEVIHCIN